MAGNKVSKAWIHQHLNDPYVQRATAEGWRSRAAFKLLEIDQRDRLIRPGALVVDLGSAPGSWSQVAAKRVGSAGTVVAVDLLPMEPVPGVHFVQGDFGEQPVADRMLDVMGGRPADLVLSDMAPNLSGIAATDAARMSHLADLSLDFVSQWLRPGGDFLIKLFHGRGFDEMRHGMEALFSSVAVRKPKASRDRSSEVYLLGKNRR